MKRKSGRRNRASRQESSAGDGDSARRLGQETQFIPSLGPSVGALWRYRIGRLIIIGARRRCHDISRAARRPAFRTLFLRSMRDVSENLRVLASHDCLDQARPLGQGNPARSRSWTDAHRGRGGIGRRAGFRFPWRKSWGFESLRPHHPLFWLRQPERPRADDIWLRSDRTQRNRRTTAV